MAKRKKIGRGRGHIQISPEQAALYGVKVPKEQESSDRYLSPNDIGKILNLTGEAVKQWIYHRRLPAVKLANGYWKVKVSDFESFLKTRQEVSKRRILVLDSKDEVMADIVGIIKEMGHDPVVSHGYADALLKALNFHPALYVVNVSLKDADPWKLIEKIRATKALRKTPILIVSDADLNDTQSDLAVRMSVQGFLKRPIDKPTLENAVNLAMNIVSVG